MADPTAPPTLGYGNASEATLDQVNIWMRGTPWYQSLLKSWGQDPGHPHDLSDSQKAQIVKGAQANGVVVDEGTQEIDDNGNFRDQGHKLRNTLIVAGIAAATIATMGAAGVFAGAAGGALGGAEGAGAAAGLGGVEAGAASGIGSAVASGALAGGAGAGLGTGAALGAGVGAAGLGGVEAGAASGLGAAALPGAGTALGATGATAAGAAGATGLAGDALASSATVPTATGTVAGGSGLTASGLASDGSTLAAGAGNGASPLASGSTLSTLLGAAGKGIGAATTAAGQNNLNQEQLGLQANNSNITGQSAFETELMNRAKTEASQRTGALADVYRQSYSTADAAGTGPKVSPYNTAGSPVYSPAYLAALKNLQTQGSTKLATGAQYDTNAMPALAPYTPINPANVQGATNTKPGALQTIGEWASPAASILSAASKYWGS